MNTLLEKIVIRNRFKVNKYTFITFGMAKI